jgi:aminomethyltransferase
MSMQPTALKKTALHAAHQKLNARLVPFAGYEMPVQYSKGLVVEHQAVRQKAGLFDVSHMGILKVSGAEIKNFLNDSLTRDLSQITPGRAAYSLLCYENGGTVDDLIVYCEKDDSFFIVLNASNKEKDFEYLKKLAQSPRWAKSIFHWEAHFESHGLLALQGPQSEAILRKAGWQDNPFPKPFTFLTNQKLFQNLNTHLAFTGYTGEIGCEIFCANSDLPKLWNQLLEIGAPFGLEPIGLGARDTLRTEMGYSLYGHELSDSINPIEAGLKWAVGLKKENFIGKTALEKAFQNPARKLISLKAPQTKQAARPDMPVFGANGKKVGHVSSGTFAPSLGYSIALALVANDAQAPYTIDIRGTKVPFELTERPFLKK